MVSVFNPFYKEERVALALPRYESDQLVSMIGSKRPIIEHLRMLLAPLAARKGTTRFVDPFCGSGAVSRLARSMGMEVHACDLEPFSYILNHVYLSLGSEDLVPMFSEMGGLDAYLSMLNLHGMYAASTDFGIERPYLSRYYAPREDSDADGMRERLFFTSANARFLDAVREEIEESWIDGKLSANEKAVVLALILHEASRKANISGTFTSFHKRLDTNRSRILEECRLQAPVLADADLPRGHMHQCEASRFVAGCAADICYLDPPASVHQYGSAYHLLNSITLWDGYAPSDEKDGQGHLMDRAGIRSDWKTTHSAFCSLKESDAAFVHLINAIDARHIVLTYPSSGPVSASRIVELLSARHAPVKVIPLHRRNQGGRQPKSGKRNLEQVFITGKEAAFHIPAGEGLSRLPLFERLDALVSEVFARPVAVEPLRLVGGAILETPLPTGILLAMPFASLEQVVGDLEREVCADAPEAMRVLAKAIEDPLTSPAGRVKLEKRALAAYRSSVQDGDTRMCACLLQIAREEGVRSRVVDAMAALSYDGHKE